MRSVFRCAQQVFNEVRFHRYKREPLAFLCVSVSERESSSEVLLTPRAPWESAMNIHGAAACSLFIDPVIGRHPWSSADLS